MATVTVVAEMRGRVLRRDWLRLKMESDLLGTVMVMADALMR